jgi:ornithine cyclodeaminase/alanine dehydrogenase-like protein (mu-crystallin family)
VRFLDGDTIRRLVPMEALLDAVEAAYRDVAEGRDRSPVRTRIALPDGDLLLMPGTRDGGTAASVKLVTVMAGNAGRGLPVVQALIAVFDAETGEPRAILDGTTVTGMRTGAASGVATRLLARPDASVLGLIGAGAQAAWQVRAVCTARAIRELRVYSPAEERRNAFAHDMAQELAGTARVTAVSSAREAVEGADVVCCATSSASPVFDAEWVAPGAHVNGIGAYRLDMVEMPPELFERASLVAVDSRAAALEEAGDLVAALAGGRLAADAYVEIGSIPAEWATTRDRRAITLFKSVGLAIQDLAAAELIASRSAGATV